MAGRLGECLKYNFTFENYRCLETDVCKDGELLIMSETAAEKETNF